MDILSKAPKLAWDVIQGAKTAKSEASHKQPNPSSSEPVKINIPTTSGPPPMASPASLHDENSPSPSASPSPSPESPESPVSPSKDAQATETSKVEPFTFIDPFFKSDSTFESFNFIKTLGRGTFGKVKLAEHIQTRRKVAIKIIEKANIKTERQRNCVKRELRLMMLLHHPFIIEVIDVIETDSKIGIVMEYAENGELFDYIVKKKCLSERESKEIFQQILSAIEYCHSHCIIHRDLKPENLLLDRHMKVKLVDFGFGNTFDGVKLLDTFCGSPFYAAPEMIKGICYSGPSSDIWSLGVILYAMLCGKLPFDAQDLRRLYEKIASGVFKCPPHLSIDAVDLLNSMIRVDPRQRASIDRIKRHPWLQPLALPLKTVPFSISQPLNPILMDLISTFGFPKEMVVSMLTKAIHPITSSNSSSLTSFTSSASGISHTNPVVPTYTVTSTTGSKFMHPILGYYSLLSASPLVQTHLLSFMEKHSSKGSTDSVYTSLPCMHLPIHCTENQKSIRVKETHVFFQTWSLTTDHSTQDTLATVEAVLLNLNVTWKLEKHVFLCKKDAKKFEIAWIPVSQTLQIRQMHGTGCGAFCSFLLTEVKRMLDDLSKTLAFSMGQFKDKQFYAK